MVKQLVKLYEDINSKIYMSQVDIEVFRLKIEVLKLIINESKKPN